MNSQIYIGLLFFLIGNIIAWVQFNGQFVWEYFKDKPFVSNLIFAIPMGMFFWYAVKNIVDATGQLWTSKLLGFGVSNIVFAVMTYIFMKESVFTLKTMTCMSLASLIIFIQLYWK